MELHVKTTSGKTVIVELESDASLMDLREKILDKEGVPMYRQTFMFAGRQIYPAKILSEQGRQNGSNLQMVNRLRSEDPYKIRLKKEDGTIIDSYEAKYSTPIPEFKKVIADKEGVAVEKISLKWKDTTILDENFVGDYYPSHIGHLDVFVIEK